MSNNSTAQAMHPQHNKPGTMMSTPPQSMKTAGGGTSSISPQNKFSSPTRLRSPRGSPRKVSSADSYLFAFLRNTKHIMTILVIVAVFAILHRPSIEPSSTGVRKEGISTVSPIDFSFLPTTISGSSSNQQRQSNDDDSVLSTDNNDYSFPETDYDPSIHPPPSPPSQEQELIPSQLPLKQRTTTSTTSSTTNKTVASLPSSTLDVISNNVIEHQKAEEMNQKLRQSYNASKYPVFSKPQQVQVHLIVDVSRAISPPSKFLLDGMERSTYTRLLALTFLNPKIKTVGTRARKSGSGPMVWVVDWGSMNRDCHRLDRVLDHLGRKTTEKVVLMDFSASNRRPQCKFFEDGNIRLTKRAVTQNRNYDFDRNRIQSGTFLENKNRVLHSPLVLREKFMDAIQNISTNILQVSERPIDVGFFWKNGDFSHYGFYRRKISKTVRALHHTIADGHGSIDTYVGIAANDEEGMVEGNVQLEYVQKLVQSKIVVVAQRDEWDDHYRLMESLASGALVMTDPVIAPPAGLQNKTNIIIYENESQLKKLIRYYLKNDSKRRAIAKKGFELAAGRHRAWHRIEEILFGRPLTHVDSPYTKLEKHKRPKTKLLVQDPIITR